MEEVYFFPFSSVEIEFKHQEIGTQNVHIISANSWRILTYKSKEKETLHMRLNFSLSIIICSLLVIRK